MHFALAFGLFGIGISLVPRLGGVFYGTYTTKTHRLFGVYILDDIHQVGERLYIRFGISVVCDEQKTALQFLSSHLYERIAVYLGRTPPASVAALNGWLSHTSLGTSL